MPSSVPYDHPSLVIGNIVDTRVLDIQTQIGNAQSVIDAAQQKMNSFIAMKRSIEMTKSELIDMKVDVSGLKADIQKIDQDLSKSASEYLDARLKGEAKIQKLREKLSSLTLSKTLESPLDFAQSKLISQPFYSESLKLDAQYFSFESNLQDDITSNIESFIK